MLPLSLSLVGRLQAAEGHARGSRSSAVTCFADLASRCACLGEQAFAAERAPGAQVNIKRFDAFQGASPCNQTAALDGQRFAGDLLTWMAGGPVHPLAHYTLRSWLPYWAGQGKCMVHPDHMAAYQARGPTSCYGLH